ncbi:dephospho-CoA kinase [Ramlibacter sp. 2FC]|uniref:dephospho-CoA kinase n=1 Tax=Ramlibacter sp. 2FC TaxID=2502188 RepID=UPI0010F97F3C|nr:dephospho-CoA kinase [Ramlibacter sp. 2FC]
MATVTLLGLTGGIGSGKSTVAAMLAEHGAAVVDADAIARGVTAPGGAAIPAIAQAFGAELITPQGALDRDRMRALVFADPNARRRLEAIVHPLVGQETERQAQAALAQGRRTVVYDVPLLVESGRRWRQKVQRVLVVDCPVVTQVERVMARSGLAQAEVERIVASQASRAQRLAAADIVIHNQGLTLPALREEVRQLAQGFGL